MKKHVKIRAIDSMRMMLSIVTLYLLLYGIIYMILGVSLTPFIMVLLALFAGEKYKRKIN